MRPVLLIATAFCLTACSVGQEAVRDQAKSTVNSYVAQKWPGVNVSPITDCIIDNSSTGEVLSLAKGARFGVTPGTVQTIQTVLSRPATQSCIMQNGMRMLQEQGL